MSANGILLISVLSLVVCAQDLDNTDGPSLQRVSTPSSPVSGNPHQIPNTNTNYSLTCTAPKTSKDTNTTNTTTTLCKLVLSRGHVQQHPFDDRTEISSISLLGDTQPKNEPERTSPPPQTSPPQSSASSSSTTLKTKRRSLPGLATNVDLSIPSITLRVTEVKCETAGHFRCDVMQFESADEGGREECAKAVLNRKGDDGGNGGGGWNNSLWITSGADLTVQVEPDQVTMNVEKDPENPSRLLLHCSVFTTLEVHWVWEAHNGTGLWSEVQGNITSLQLAQSHSACWLQHSLLGPLITAPSDTYTANQVFRCYVIAGNHSYVARAAYYTQRSNVVMWKTTLSNSSDDKNKNFLTNGGLGMVMIGGTIVALIVIVVLLVKLQRLGVVHWFTQTGSRFGGDSRNNRGAMGLSSDENPASQGSSLTENRGMPLALEEKPQNQPSSSPNKRKQRHSKPVPSLCHADVKARDEQPKKRNKLKFGKRNKNCGKRDNSGAGDQGSITKREHPDSSTAAATGNSLLPPSVTTDDKDVLIQRKDTLKSLDKVIGQISAEAEMATARILNLHGSTMLQNAKDSTHSGHWSKHSSGKGGASASCKRIQLPAQSKTSLMRLRMSENLKMSSKEKELAGTSFTEKATQSTHKTNNSSAKSSNMPVSPKRSQPFLQVFSSPRKKLSSYYLVKSPKAQDAVEQSVALAKKNILSPHLAGPWQGNRQSKPCLPQTYSSGVPQGKLYLTHNQAPNESTSPCTVTSPPKKQESLDNLDTAASPDCEGSQSLATSLTSPNKPSENKARSASSQSVTSKENCRTARDNKKRPEVSESGHLNVSSHANRQTLLDSNEGKSGKKSSNESLKYHASDTLPLGAGLGKQNCSRIPLRKFTSKLSSLDVKDAKARAAKSASSRLMGSTEATRKTKTSMPPHLLHLARCKAIEQTTRSTGDVRLFRKGGVLCCPDVSGDYRLRRLQHSYGNMPKVSVSPHLTSVNSLSQTGTPASSDWSIDISLSSLGSSQTSAASQRSSRDDQGKVVSQPIQLSSVYSTSLTSQSHGQSSGHAAHLTTPCAPCCEKSGQLVLQQDNRSSNSSQCFLPRPGFLHNIHTSAKSLTVKDTSLDRPFSSANSLEVPRGRHHRIRMKDKDDNSTPVFSQSRPNPFRKMHSVRKKSRSLSTAKIMSDDEQNTFDLLEKQIIKESRNKPRKPSHGKHLTRTLTQIPLDKHKDLSPPYNPNRSKQGLSPQTTSPVSYKMPKEEAILSRRSDGDNKLDNRTPQEFALQPNSSISPEH